MTCFILFWGKVTCPNMLWMWTFSGWFCDYLLLRLHVKHRPSWINKKGTFCSPQVSSRNQDESGEEESCKLRAQKIWCSSLLPGSFSWHGSRVGHPRGGWWPIFRFNLGEPKNIDQTLGIHRCWSTVPQFGSILVDSPGRRSLGERPQVLPCCLGRSHRSQAHWLVEQGPAVGQKGHAGRSPWAAAPCRTRDGQHLVLAHGGRRTRREAKKGSRSSHLLVF